MTFIPAREAGKARGIRRSLRAGAVLAGLLATAGAAAQSNDFIYRTSNLPTGRAFGGTAVLGDYIYYFGGAKGDGKDTKTEGPTNEVMKAKILANGQLGPWEQSTPLPETRHYIENSTLVLNDVVYIVGGSTRSSGGERLNTAVFSRPLPNGTLLPWAVSQPFGEGLSTITAVSTPGHIHVIGGLRKDGTASDQVWTNTIYADGSMGAWSAGPQLPMPLWYHSAGAASGRVYVWGGMPKEDTKTTTPRIFSAPILGSGRLGAWREESVKLPRPFYGASTAVAGNYLLSFCPRYGGKEKGSDVWYAVATPTGLSQWNHKVSGVPNVQYHCAAPDYRRGLIFFGGGRPGFLKPMLSDMFFFPLTANARQSAEQTWLAHQRAHQNTVAAFPAQGTGTQQTTSTLTYTVASKLPPWAQKGFKTYGDARAESGAQKKPLVVYFHLEGAQPCADQKAILAAPEFQQMASEACWAWVETQDNPQLAQQLGVYRVPTWIFYDRAGNEVADARTIGTKSVMDLAKVVMALK